MKVSAIVPTFNRARLLRRALASIADQTYRDVEVIIVDDGSVDDTAEVVSEISATFPFPICYCRQTNGGCASARNRGLRMATGELFAFLDSDDEWTPGALAQMVAALDGTAADFVYSPAIEVSESGAETLNLPVAAHEPERLADEHFERTNLRNGSALFRKSVIDAVGDLDESLQHNEDSDFIQRVAIRCKGAYVDLPSVRVLNHGERKSANRVAILQALLASAEKILKTNPEFARGLGERADRRLRQIRSQLLAALILAGRIPEARGVARELGSVDDLWARFALWSGSVRPFALACRLRAAWKRWSGRLASALRSL
jgi:glycosyltransferase involved in cell wall biosynthesis